MSMRIAINGFGRIGRALFPAKVKILAWYDNEMGYTESLIWHVFAIAKAS